MKNDINQQGLARRSIIGAVAAVPAATALTVFGISEPAQAAAPLLTVTIEPVEGGSARFLKLAPNVSGGAETAKLIFRLRIVNNGGASVNVTGIRFAFPGSAVATKIMANVAEGFGGSAVINSGSTKDWSNGKITNGDNAVYLAMPAPPTLRVEVTCAGFADPATTQKSLAAYVCPNAGGYRMPFNLSDMRIGEVMVAAGEHWANGGSGGSQIYSHDVGVNGWNQLTGAWSERLPGTDGSKNEHYRIWNKPVRAVADGVITERFDGMPDNTVLGSLPNPTPSPVDGNHLWIRHGTEYVRYTHMRNGTIPAGLTVGTNVVKGQLLGRAGNSGNSSNPHFHIEVRKSSAISGVNWALRPWAQGSAWMIAQTSNTPFNPAGGWVQANGRGIPKTRTLIWPASTAPSWYPPGKPEITVYGVKLADYQTTFNRVTAVGYRLVWFDGYEVGGTSYVNAIFRPVGGLGWTAKHGLTSAQLTSEIAVYKANGIQPVNLASYLNGTTVQYALCGVTQVGPDFRAYPGKTGTDHQNTFNAWTAEGYAPINISIVSPGNQPRFSGLYVKKSIGGFVAASWLTPAEYQTQWNDNSGAGRHLIYLGGCQHSGAPRLSAIFASGAPGSGGTVGRHDMTITGLQSNLIKWTDSGLLTRAIAGYDRGGTANFGAAWRA